MSWKYSEMALFSDAALRLKNLICPTATPMAHIDLERLSLRLGAAIGCGG